MVNQQIFLPMIPDGAPIVVNVSQYDYDAAGYTGRLYFNLVSNGVAYDMNGATATFQGVKPDGKAFAYPGVVVNASVVRVNLRQQMTVVAGRVVCSLVLNNSEGQVGSYNVWLEVQPSSMTGSDPSETDIPSLIAQARQYAEDAEQSAATAASYTAHPPYIGANYNWYVWDVENELYIDSGVEALGQGISSIVKTGTAGLVDTYTITYTSGETTTFEVTNGSAPTITVTATTDATSSTNPTVTVTKTGTDQAPTYAMAFSGLKGEPGPTGQPGQTGPQGVGIQSITKTATQGLVDTYTITLTNGATTTFTVTNGQNGTGSGDMLQINYDPTQAVFNAGGIPDYVAAHAAVYTAGANINISASNEISADVPEVVNALNSTSSTKALSANMGNSLNQAIQTVAGNIPTVDQSYSAVSTNAQSGTAVAGALSNYYTKSEIDAQEENLVSYGGAVTFATLPALSAANLNKFFLVTDSFTTTADFVVGAGKSMPADSHIAIINTGTEQNPVYKYDDFGGFIDTSTLQTKTIPAMSVQGASVSTVENALTALNTGTPVMTAMSAVGATIAGCAVFTGLDDTGGVKTYIPCFASTNNGLPHITDMQWSGSQSSNMTVYVYTDAPAGTNCRLLIIRGGNY